MQTQPLVSVIIAFLNEEKFLSETIKSVLAQTYLNWELLLVDDGSTNQSTGIAKQFAADHPGKIFYLEHEGHVNKGVCVSRNLGVKNSKGNLIAILDADDVWLPEKLQKQVAIFQKYPDLGLVAEGSTHWYSWNDPKAEDIEIPVGSLYEKNRVIRLPAHQDKVFGPVELLYSLYPLSKGAAAGPCAWLLSKKAIIKAGGFEESFTKEYQLYEDQAFLCKIYLREKVYLSSECNNLYRQRPGSVVQWVNEKGHYHKVRAYFLNWLENYFQHHNISDAKLKKLLNQALLPYRNPNWFFISRTLPKKLLRLSLKPLRLLTRFLTRNGILTKQPAHA
ncbi:glycosyltransferase family 2 protein [Adhaeribacter sp. BT258]|uniref:Glycosyltransferase family 2 protein n=1 Tax=Adhaeribacter terrigena TaxID=2793070 RepID=A0ABS1BXN4_9BACT|nr:glycosyltransferase family 2 protein [Adhaeribacter terrigena]MBK0401905.1 glycosyltransferase family 2 protein [Adhaeribacter terrigena]